MTIVFIALVIISICLGIKFGAFGVFLLFLALGSGAANSGDDDDY